MKHRSSRRSTWPLLGVVSLIVCFSYRQGLQEVLENSPAAVAEAVNKKQQQQQKQQLKQLTFDEFVVPSAPQQQQQQQQQQKEGTYDPRSCLKIGPNGSCEDSNGGAWTYMKPESNQCVYTEEEVPRDSAVVQLLPRLFPGAQSIMDFGGGVGAFLTAFRDAGVLTLVTVEPHPLGACLFRGIQQDTTDWMNTPLSNLPNQLFDVVITIEVAEHIPVALHPHLIQALAQATRNFLVFSAAHPGQGGQGHSGPSMKTRDQWVQQIETSTLLRVDQELTKQLHAVSSRTLRRNCIIFRKNPV